MPSTQPEQKPVIRVMLGGDVMLGRIVKKAIRQFGPHYPLEQIADLMRSADVTIVNLECAMTSCTDVWGGAPKAFYFGAPLRAIRSLQDAGVDLVSLANNHTLDFGVEGLFQTTRLLRRHGIRYAGAGADLAEAFLPATIECRDIKLGMAAFCDHQPDFAAQRKLPGIAYLDLNDETAAISTWRKSLDVLLRDDVDWPILSLHWGPNMVLRPSEKFRRLAHAAIDMGWKILFGHSAHVFHGIEIYRGCPILYAAGDLVDDYYVDPDFRNDHQLLFELELTSAALRRIHLYPVFIEHCRTTFADAEQSRNIVERMTALCSEMGTHVRHEAGKTWIECPQSLEA